MWRAYVVTWLEHHPHLHHINTHMHSLSPIYHIAITFTPTCCRLKCWSSYVISSSLCSGHHDLTWTHDDGTSSWCSCEIMMDSTWWCQMMEHTLMVKYQPKGLILDIRSMYHHDITCRCSHIDVQQTMRALLSYVCCTSIWGLSLLSTWLDMHVDDSQRLSINMHV